MVGERESPEQLQMPRARHPLIGVNIYGEGLPSPRLQKEFPVTFSITVRSREE